jgi:hypothetical protein
VRPGRSDVERDARAPVALARPGDDGVGAQGDGERPASQPQSPTRSRFLSTSTTGERPLVPPCDYESGRLLNLDTELVLGADGQVKGGTLPALVSRLYADDQHHASYVNLFMHTFRAFVDSARLLRILQATYTALLPVSGDDSDAVKTEKKRYRLRVGNALKKLVEECHDDDTNAALTDEFVTFIDTSMFPNDDTLALTIKLKFFQRQSIVSTQLEQQFSEPAPKPILPRSGTRASIHTLEPVELARQMTLLDSELLRKIGPFELIGVAYGAKSGAQLRAPNLLAMIARFNCTSNFVVATHRRREAAQGARRAAQEGAAHRRRVPQAQQLQRRVCHCRRPQ